MLEGLAYLMDNPRKIPIVATNNKIYGQLDINVVPCNENGDEELNEDLLTDDPMDLLNQALDFKVKISQISNLPEDFCREIYCEYEFYMDKAKYSTSPSPGKNTSPTINYERQHHVDCVTKFLIDYMLEDKLTIKIYGTQELKRKKQTAPKTNSNQIVSKPTRPIMSGGVNTSYSGDQSKLPGIYSTMNSSVSSHNSGGNNYKIQGHTVSAKQMIQPKNSSAVIAN
jgi:hypothetical protein